MRFLRTVTAAVTACAVWTAVLPAPVYAEEKDSEQFEQFCEEEFIRRMESDYMNMHYTVKDYAGLSITKPELTVGDASWESFETEVQRADESLEKLHKINPENLNEDQQLVYKTYERYLESYRELNAMPLFESYFDPAAGIIDNLTTNFTEFIFYTPEDVEDYLTVLSTVPAYIDQALEVTRRQAKEGFFLRDDQLDMTEEAIDEFTAKTDDSMLIVIFNERIDELEGLSDEQKEKYKQRNRDIVINSYIPSYRKAKEELEKLRGSRSFEGGTANYENGGAEYYAALARYKTSSQDSVEKLLDDCGIFLEDLVDQYIDLYMRNPAVDDLYETETTKLSGPDEVLEYLQSHLEMFPEGPEVTYEYDYLDPSVANDATVAYYLAPPIDDITHNIVRINEKAVGEDPNELYSTLAHEAFPGHLFQITWFLNQPEPFLRRSYDFIGYQEGWGMYSEWCAWEFSDINPDAAELNRIYIALSYVEDAAVDLAVNGLGWSIPQVSNWLESLGLNGSSAQEIADFVIQRPGLLLPYGVGMMKFLTLRKNAEEALGDKFDLKEFNTVLMKGGDRPFEYVEADVQNYIHPESEPAPEEITEEEIGISPEPGIPWEIEEPEVPAEVRPYLQYPYAWIGLGAAGVIALIAGFNLYRRRRKGPFA